MPENALVPKRWLLHSFPDQQDRPFTFLTSGEVTALGHERFDRALDYLLLEYVVQGTGWLEIDGVRWRIAAGDVYLVPAGVQHAIWPERQDPWHKLWVGIGGELAEALIAAYGLSGIVQVSGTAVETVFRQLITLSQLGSDEAIDQAALAMHGLIQTLATRAGCRGGRRHSVPVRTVMDYLDRHFRDTVSLDDLASLIKRSRSQLVRLFRAETDRTPYGYLLDRRIDHARHLLTTTDLRIHEIAEELGFADQYHFSAQFRKRTGLSPRQCRQGRQ